MIKLVHHVAQSKVELVSTLTGAGHSPPFLIPCAELMIYSFTDAWISVRERDLESLCAAHDQCRIDFSP
jgi:hypothetical protein